VVVRQKGGLAAGQKTTRRLAGLSRNGGSRYTKRCVGPRRRPNGKPGRVAEPLRFVANARSSAGRFGPRISSLSFSFNFLLRRTAIIACDALGRRLRKIQCLQLSVCWCPDPLNYPHVIAVTKCASQASTQLRNRATPTSVFINAPRVPVRCGLLFGLPTRRLRDRGTGRAFHR
jgi:hypothetical protein